MSEELFYPKNISMHSGRLHLPGQNADGEKSQGSGMFVKKRYHCSFDGIPYFY
jgi:hypothetical protein